MNGLEKRVRDLIEDLYKCEFVGKLTVEKHGWLYMLKLFYAELKIPAITLASQCCSDDEFLEFVKHELEKSNIIRTKHHKLIIYGSDDCPQGF